MNRVLNWQRRWDPFREFEREVGRLFATIEPLVQGRVRRPFPALNLYDTGSAYLLKAEVPGMTADDLDVSLTAETLTLRGERKRPEGISDESYRRQERPFGTWSRSVTLPDRIDANGVTAEFADGILTVTLPRSAEARPRQIAVTNGARPVSTTPSVE